MRDDCIYSAHRYGMINWVSEAASSIGGAVGEAASNVASAATRSLTGEQRQTKAMLILKEDLMNRSAGFMSWYHLEDTTYAVYMINPYTEGTNQIPQKLFSVEDWRTVVLRPWLASYYILYEQPATKPEELDVQQADTFITHLMQDFIGLYCEQHQFAAIGEKAIKLYVDLDSYGIPIWKSIEDEYKAYQAAKAKNKNFAADKFVQKLLAYIFQTSVTMTHIMIMTSGFASQAVAMVFGLEDDVDTIAGQLVKLYANHTDFFHSYGKQMFNKVTGLLTFGLSDVALIPIWFGYEHVMMLWKAHYWAGLTAPMTALVEHIKRQRVSSRKEQTEEQRNEERRRITRSIEDDPYWMQVPMNYKMVESMCKTGPPPPDPTSVMDVDRVESVHVQ